MSTKQRPFSMYHSVLRVSLLVCAIALVFESGMISQSTAILAQNTHTYLANAVGMSVGVAPTELNQYTAALTKKQKELEVREAAVTEREINLKQNPTTANNTNQTVTYILAAILLVLLFLILLNYTLDYLRARDKSMAQTV